MPSLDVYHDVVRAALLKDGWQITHDPFHIRWGSKDVYIDLGAEQLLAAEQGERKIAVEIKSFLSPSPLKDLEQALGQFILYHDILAQIEPDRILYLAIRKAVYFDLFSDPAGKILLDNQRLRLIVFDANAQEIVKWIP